MIGGSPAPPKGPMRRLVSCSNGWFVCGLTLRFRLRFEPFLLGLVRCCRFLLFAIKLLSWTSQRDPAADDVTTDTFELGGLRPNKIFSRSILVEVSKSDRHRDLHAFTFSISKARRSRLRQAGGRGSRQVRQLPHRRW